MLRTAARTTLRASFYRPTAVRPAAAAFSSSPLRPNATPDWEQLVGGKAKIAYRKAEYEEKYVAALEAKAKEQGVSVDDLKASAAAKANVTERMGSAPRAGLGPVEAGSMDTRKTPDELKEPDVVKPLPSAEQDAQKTQAAPVGKQGEQPVKPLHEIMDLSKVPDLDAPALSQVWTTYHQAKGFLSAAIPTETYLRLVNAARKYPMFVLPLTRKAELPEGQEAETATEMHLLEWALLPQPTTVTEPVPAPSTVLFTPLAEYKARQSWAQPYLILTHYTDLSASHGVVLMRGEISSNVALNATDAQVLAVRMQLFYNDQGKNGEIEQARRNLLRAFHETPEQFSVDELIRIAGHDELHLFTLADLLDKLTSTLSHAAAQAGPVASRSLNLTSSTLHNGWDFIQHSDNPAAQAIVSVLTDPRIEQYYNKAIDLALRNAPLLISVVGLVLHLIIGDQIRRRDARKQQSRLLQLRADSLNMADYGLGTPSAAAAGGAKRRADDYGLVEVQWGREKIRVPLPPPQSPLSTLKAALYNITGVPPDHQKLIFSGAVLKDDLAPLSAYQLVDTDVAAAPDAGQDKPKSFWDSWSFLRSDKQKKLKKLIMLGSKDVSARVDDRLSNRKDLADLAAAEAAAPAEAKVDDEPTVQRRIREISTERLAELEPRVEAVEAYIAQEQRKKAGQAVEGEELSAPQPRTLLFLSETLLQGLLRLDSIEVPSTYMAARGERKDAVKRVQAVLDRVDAAKEAMKALGQ
ncbi:hypothetical protein JCM10207_004327 [Rhodosporidiobolus poonsookiae]